MANPDFESNEIWWIFPSSCTIPTVQCSDLINSVVEHKYCSQMQVTNKDCKEDSNILQIINFLLYIKEWVNFYIILFYSRVILAIAHRTVYEYLRCSLLYVLSVPAMIFLLCSLNTRYHFFPLSLPAIYNRLSIHVAIRMFLTCVIEKRISL